MLQTKRSQIYFGKRNLLQKIRKTDVLLSVITIAAISHALFAMNFVAYFLLFQSLRRSNLTDVVPTKNLRWPPLVTRLLFQKILNFENQKADVLFYQ